jgi:hypothetical protein
MYVKLLISMFFMVVTQNSNTDFMQIYRALTANGIGGKVEAVSRCFHIRQPNVKKITHKLL